MKRLYVGGLSHTVTQKDLRDRFGKFGEVQDVEVRTRRDDQGVPYKTFGYINMNISDVDFHRCMTVLNKSKWKGGTLQIEAAKDSFLHRLAQERQALSEEGCQGPVLDPKDKVLASLRSAGVENFHMKSAVPGTEVPGHKAWVVSKFGRVLPVLNLKCQSGTRSRTMKYDPSKYSHNIKRLELPNSDQPVPVCKLTWVITGGDDDISRKRRGEFPPHKPWRMKRSRAAPEDMPTSGSAPAEGRTRQGGVSVQTNGFIKVSHGDRGPPGGLRQRTWTKGLYGFDHDVDSDEDIRMLVESQQSSHDALRQDVDDDNLEVVGDGYQVKSNRFQQWQKGGGDEEEEEYDSADTDELLSSRRPPSQQEKKPLPAVGIRNTKRKRGGGEDEKDEESLRDTDQLFTSRTPLKQQRNHSGRPSPPKTHSGKGKEEVSPVLKPLSLQSDIMISEEEEEEEEEDDDSGGLESSSSDYEALFSHCTRLEISLADLQKLAEDSLSADGSDEQEPAPCHTSNSPTSSMPSASSEPAAIPPPNNPPRQAHKTVPKKGITPEEILAAILEDEDSDKDEKKKRKKKKSAVSAPLPTFQGTRALIMETYLTEEEKKESFQLNHTSHSSKEESLEGVAPPPGTDSTPGGGADLFTPQTTLSLPTPQTSCSSTDSSAEEEKTGGKSQVVELQSNKTEEPSSEEESSSSSSEDEKVCVRAPGGGGGGGGGGAEKEQQRQDNLRRLAAVERRRREMEQHRKLIQGALASVDAPASTGRHIVFASDEEDDENETKDMACQKTSISKLFDSSEDEEDGDESQDDSRFQVKPQFEGRAGQKMLEMQARFGTDQRFRLNARFLESDEEERDEEQSTERKRSGMEGKEEEEESLEEEKQKSLSILQSILHTNIQPSSKTVSKTKTFRDVSALHYDPSREEHAAYETSQQQQEKESKAARKRKRLEAEKVPEVSKEIFFDVAADLKDLFGGTKEHGLQSDGERSVGWDREEEMKEEQEEGEKRNEDHSLLVSLLSADSNTAKEDSSGFKFSFFGEETESRQTAEYHVETIQRPDIPSWQLDPRFHDSSSEEEEEEGDEKENKKGDAEGKPSTTSKTPEEQPSSKTNNFFFSLKDDRLTDGPRLFCRSSKLEVQRDEWEERRSALRQEYKKKHKHARRKLLSSQRS
ncbi:nucleolar protein 8 [Lampris incognitus]|uniref:nucleolar protein 8 n=1 Tax=Lampris incognitus TaxID=2546036 RepID=UPI0024B5B56D|nr:nucleolar protein 8 [Lampris incognitus]XP_056129904.1 nucleolar protein 8 [Lampris incognitus]